jgi:hypothetical protein
MGQHDRQSLLATEMSQVEVLLSAHGVLETCTNDDVSTSFVSDVGIIIFIVLRVS